VKRQRIETHLKKLKADASASATTPVPLNLLVDALIKPTRRQGDLTRQSRDSSQSARWLAHESRGSAPKGQKGGTGRPAILNDDTRPLASSWGHPRLCLTESGDF